jgi:hypothetical protein
MRNIMRLSVEEVIEVHNGHMTDGLSFSAISSLRRIHGLNKFEDEPKVTQMPCLFKMYICI